VNLDADEGHSKRMFDLIETVCTNELEKKQVMEGSQMALDARILFYDGLKNLESLAFA
jgi:pyrroloquinoline-quinone synthase